MRMRIILRLVYLINREIVEQGGGYKGPEGINMHSAITDLFI